MEQKQFKLNNVAIGNKYGVGESVIRGWKKIIDLSLTYDKNKKTLHSGRESIYDHFEGSLIQYVDKLRDIGHSVTHSNDRI